MKPTLYQLLTMGTFSYSQIAHRLGMRRTAVHWFALELERRGWIQILPSHIGLIGSSDGEAIRFLCGKLGVKQ
ncbi:hypothetical protein N3K64_04695 [Escherichia coli]|uniref:hypothetical protein n=1 Tax=Escherichia coli TaxID=562 RepID=UPI0021BF51BF|nr:hypothetical protein [Escherichia coli]MCT9829188.1 hypothetical protein [Escherichia coli]